MSIPTETERDAARTVLVKKVKADTLPKGTVIPRPWLNNSNSDLASDLAASNSDMAFVKLLYGLLMW